jgi:hypothetical protein
MMEATWFPETWIDFQRPTQHYVPENRFLHFFYLSVFFFESFKDYFPNIKTQLLSCVANCGSW